MAGSITIEIVSDFVCPWCFIGSARLDEALASRRVAAKLVHAPFLLDPTVPDEGADLRAWLQARYGDPEPMVRRVEAVAREAGITIDFTKVRRHPSTLRAHTLMRLARERGDAHGLAKMLFGAYFGEGRDLGAMDVLIELGRQGGLDEAEMVRWLESRDERERTRALARHEGITGVPVFFFQETDAAPGAKRLAVKGAQPLEVFTSLLERLAPEAS